MASKDEEVAQKSPKIAEENGLQVIVLGPTGGPCEDNVTGMLVRSTSTDWRPDSIIAVDAGVLLCGLRTVLETSGDNGPFAGMSMPHKTAKANAAHILRETVGSVLITHAHLDHISGLVLNTPIFEATIDPKRVTALPEVIAAFKEHVFNGILWPNLSDENGGAGLITFHRLIEGGNQLMGQGEEKGYVRACEGLMTRCFAVSHGRCNEKKQEQNGAPPAPSTVDPGVLRGQEDPSLPVPSPSTALAQAQSSQSPRESYKTVESSAFFLRDHATGKEIIIFGDLEPDTVSINPRNRHVWEKAAPKIVSNTLRAIFIECSYDDSVSDESLYGHLCPRHLVAELKVLANLVHHLRQAADRKRKRVPSPQTEGENPQPSDSTQENPKKTPAEDVESSPQQNGKTAPATLTGEEETDDSVEWSDKDKPLEGLVVFIIHIKENLSQDEDEPTSKRILRQVKELAIAENLGCDFHVPSRGENILI